MITRAKIEEMLKVAEKEYSSVMFLSDSKSFMKMKIAQAKIQLLTSLLAEDGGEDEPYMGWCDVDGCTNEASANGMYYKDTSYWRLCPKHSQSARDGNPQPKMKQSSIDRENSRDKVTRELPSQHTKGEGV